MSSVQCVVEMLRLVPPPTVSVCAARGGIQMNWKHAQYMQLQRGGIKLICVCMYVHASLWVCAGMHARLWGPENNLCCHYWGSTHFVFWDRVSEFTLGLAKWVRLAGQWLPGILLPLLPHAGFVSVHCHAQLFHMGFRDQTQSLISVWQLLYQVRHFKSMLHFALWGWRFKLFYFVFD